MHHILFADGFLALVSLGNLTTGAPSVTYISATTDVVISWCVSGEPSLTVSTTHKLEILDNQATGELGQRCCDAPSSTAVENESGLIECARGQ